MTDEEKKERKRITDQKYREANKEKISKYRKDNKHKRIDYYQQNRDRILADNKCWRDENNDRLKQYREDNKEHKSKYLKKYYQDNPKKKHYDKERRKKWIEDNKGNKKKYMSIYRKHRLKVDPMFKMICNIRTRTSMAVKKYSLSKTSSIMKMLGCDKQTLMTHLQATGELYDPNFNIYDYDGNLYHIDHKKSFKDIQNGIYTLDEVCHYTNLQILPADINLSKSCTSW